MIPVDQKYIYIDEVQNGDCWRACLSSILECPIDDFPAWDISVQWTDYFMSILNVLEGKGYGWQQYSIENVTPDCFDKYLIAVGRSPRSTQDHKINHAVIWKNGIVHDPHPDKTGIHSIETFELLYQLNP